MEAGNLSIQEAIRAAEAKTSGIVRVALSQFWLEKDPLSRAKKLFKELKLDGLPYRNAVLIYVNTRKKKYAFVVDQGLYEKTGGYQWNQIGAAFEESLKNLSVESAISTIVHVIGMLQSQHFPLLRDEVE